METINLSRDTSVTRNDGKYYYTERNRGTNSSHTQEMVFDEKGECRVNYSSSSYGIYKKDVIDINFYVASLHE